MITAMRAWMQKASPVQLGVAQGVPFGAAMGVFAHVSGDGAPWPLAVLLGVLAGAAFGAVMGPYQHRMATSVRSAAGPVADGDRGDASSELRRAVRRGEVPADPARRAAAHRVVLLQLGLLDRQRWLRRLLFPALLLLAGWLAVTDSPWWWAAAALFAVGLVGSELTVRALRRRELSLRPTG